MQDKQASRRQFLKQTSLAGLTAISIPQLVSAAMEGQSGAKKPVKLKKDAVILFQGDSITDSGRKRDDNGYNNAGVLGNGYPMLAAAEILLKNPGMGIKIFNKGISGNKVHQLAERWEKDCFELKPDVLSILIGVNDFWHKLNGNYNGTIQTYRDDYTTLLNRTKQALPDVQLVIGEPFAVSGIKAVDEKWYPAFNEYRAVAREIATQFQAIFIPYQTVFDKAAQSVPGSYWTYDGVHPGLAGARLMAQAWLQAVKW